MQIATIVYIILLIIFMGTSILILRHAIRYGYLSPRFKMVVMIFAMLSLIIILFSFYLLMGSGGSISTPSTGRSGEFNF